MPVVGTAGHVDHGKSTLIQALTGRDPDRWAEEKRRGLTIDLGFGWSEIEGREISFVDVPGHERFVKNMLAGIEAVDAALLVVAADEGWMPQTEEHAAVLHLLSIDRVVVAITKSDRVADTGPVRDQTRSKLAGLTFADAPLIDVSAIEGSGLDELRRTLSERLEDLEGVGPPVPHLWVDRSFSITGAGTVVTGTLQGGRLDQGAPVNVQPAGIESRIRSIQTHERVVEAVEPRRRVALNLGGVAVTDVPRGALVTRGTPWTESDRLLVTLRAARYAELDRKGAFQLHMGTGVWPAELQLLNERTALLRLGRAAPSVHGAPFILRESGRRLVVAGGRILDPRPARRQAHVISSIDALERAATPDDAASVMLEARGRATEAELAVDTAGGTPAGAVGLGSTIFSESAASSLAARGTSVLEEFHRAHPLRPGMPGASLGAAIGIDPGGLDDLIARAGWVRDGAAVALPSHQAELSSEESLEWQRIRSALGQGLKVPRVKELLVAPELMAALIGQGRIVRVSDDLVFLPEQLELLERRLGEFTGPFTVSEFRQALDLSRKYAVPLLEWFDKQGVTRRQGDVRVVRNPDPGT